MIQTNQSPLASQVTHSLLSLIAQSDDVFWVRSADYSEQLYISPAYERVWGQSCQSLYDHPENWIKTLLPEDADALLTEFQNKKGIIQPGEQFFHTFRIMRPDHSIRWIEDQNFAIFDDQQNHIGFAGIGRDITEKVQREKALVEARQKAEANYRAKMAFIESVRHDMRTPLKGMIGASKAISVPSEAAQAAYPELSSMIYEAGSELLAMLDGFFGLITEEALIYQEKPTPFSLQKVLDQVETLFRPALAMKPNVAYKLTIDPALPASLLGSRENLSRVLFNLLDNAVKFTDEGHIQLSLARGEGSSDKQTILKISITDTGIGIPANQFEQIFEQLTRLHPAYEERYPGMGIGLYMAKRWINAMEGEIYVKSEEGKGSEFLVAIPLAHPLLTAEEYRPVIEVK
jgi:PAS domain S-box-containing protein